MVALWKYGFQQIDKSHFPTDLPWILYPAAVCSQIKPTMSNGATIFFLQLSLEIILNGFVKNLQRK